MKDLHAVQIELEEEMHGAGILRFTKNNQRSIDSGQAGETDWFRRLTREFVRPMADAIDAYKDYYAGRRGKPSATIGHLKCISSEAAGYIAIKTIFDSMAGHTTSAQALANHIGRRIEDEIRFTKLSEAAPEYIGAIKESLKKRSNQSYKFEHDSLVHAEKELKMLSDFQALHNGGVDKQEIMRLLGADEEKYKALLEKVEYAIDFDRWIPWAQNDVLQLGAKMIDIFANNMLLNGKPVVERVTISTGTASNRQTPAAIVPTESLEAWVEEYKQVMGSIAPAYEPCVVPPRPWKSPFNGGYHSKKVSSRLNMVKCPDKKHLKRLSRSQMPKVYEAVNALQEVKWQIHPSVLAVANEIRLRGLPLGMPRMDKADKPICPVPAIYSELRGAELMACLDEDQKEAFLKWKRDTVAYYASEQKRRSDVRETIATIDQGLKFKDYEALHYVYTLDFRGRVYAQGSLISPQGGDLQKGLIRFAEAYPLGEKGAYWFKVQGANVWGWDKEIFDERVSRCETEEFKDMCLDIAADPISFTDWTKADKPWQFLAWCFEYAALLEWIDEGNDESDFLSHVAVAMDGSCSGIQHYSAMLRDSVGGKEVNLLPSDKPQDIYGAVANIVRGWMESVIDDYTQDVPMWDKIEEKFGAVKGYKFAEEWLRVCVTRSMTKKPVMTLPYGSSQLTCRDSMDDYLSDLQSKADKKALATGMATGNIHNFTDKDGDLPRNEAVSYASMMTWKAIGEVVIAARAAMKYIKEVTKVVAELGESLEWTTPLGFIVKQSVFEVREDKQVFTNMLGGCKFRVKEITDKIDARRMGSSCAPNFVHSMDASHLLLATTYFSRAGIKAIAVIHDSFGTHAGKTEELRSLLINSFVDMYLEHDVITNFKEENEERLMIEIDVEIPEQGDLDLEEVRLSPYCFA
ncbi:RNA polymerase (endogenous virus) [Gutovirus Vc1]|uniref:DNA-directed RNA polymerase n=1 Tax=Vibrio phage Vc1 TaxID=1480731 RepID=X2L0D0_9CAUD|nr:RNA polymerase [Vibrio phage Vc1]AHN84679.1 RNA polymerase [Vibrio phage Vc1]